MVDTILSDQRDIREARTTHSESKETRKINPKFYSEVYPFSLPFLWQITRDRYRRYVAQSISPRLVGTSRELLLQIATDWGTNINCEIVKIYLCS